MSAKERRRAVIMAGVQAGELNLVGAAAVLGLSYRQTQRVWRRYRAAGDAGLVHRLRGQPGPRRQAPEMRAQVLARHAERYPDFGPTLAAEYLAQEGWRVEITRRSGAGCWQPGDGPCAAAGNGTDNGARVNRALGRWCNWTVRTTTGSRDGGRRAC